MRQSSWRKITLILSLSTNCYGRENISGPQKWRCLWHLEEMIKRISILLEEKRNCCKHCKGS